MALLIQATTILLPVVIHMRESAKHANAGKLREGKALSLPVVPFDNSASSELHRMDERIVTITARIENVVRGEMHVLIIDDHSSAQHD